MKRIYFIVPYPVNCSPSQRFRFEQYFSHLRESEIQFRVSSFLSKDNWQIFYERRKPLAKCIALISGFGVRLADLGRISKFDFVFIHREAAPVGPPWIEWLIKSIIRKPIIYDFDDAIWLHDGSKASVFKNIFKWRGKVSLICKWAHKVSCGNDYLCLYASRFNKSTVCNPTVVDTTRQHNPECYQQKNSTSQITIGWTGSHSTLKYLMVIEDVLKKIQHNKEVRLLIISDKRPESFSPQFEFVPWNVRTEIEDLLQIDIGIMPLTDDPWSQGKCGFKAIQYLALGIPAVISPVGVNRAILTHGVEGYWARTNDEWERFVTQLVNDKKLRNEMGRRGREKIERQYSVTSNASGFLSLFE